jgi:hypothetical protein
VIQLKRPLFHPIDPRLSHSCTTSNSIAVKYGIHILIHSPLTQFAQQVRNVNKEHAELAHRGITIERTEYMMLFLPTNIQDQAAHCAVVEIHQRCAWFMPFASMGLVLCFGFGETFLSKACGERGSVDEEKK